MKIAITTSSFGKYDSSPLGELRKNHIEYVLNPHGRKLTEEEVIEVGGGVDGIIAGTEPLNREVLKRLPKLRVISRCGAGLDNVDVQSAAELGIKVFSTPFGPTLAVAELTIGLILALLRKVSVMDRQLKAGIWKKQMGNLLGGKRIGILGFGRIGRKVAELMMPFKVNVSYCDIRSIDSRFPFKEKKELLSWADIITLHCPSSPDGGPLIKKDDLMQMKKDAWLINAARGGLIDEAALYAVMKEGYLSGAALDVFENEPYTGPLRELDNVILTPHIGSYAKESRVQMEMEAVKNMINGL